MRRTRRLIVAFAVLVSGCALQDTRYDYSRLAAGLGDYDESIIDWNFPTSTNLGPLLPPERFRPVRPAIGVPWATSDPMPWRQGDGVTPEAVRAGTTPDDATPACATNCDGVVGSPDETTRRGYARTRELSLRQ
jgi:hypothetical protein